MENDDSGGLLRFAGAIGAWNLKWWKWFAAIYLFLNSFLFIWELNCFSFPKQYKIYENENTKEIYTHDTFVMRKQRIWFKQRMNIDKRILYKNIWGCNRTTEFARRLCSLNIYIYIYIEIRLSTQAWNRYETAFIIKLNLLNCKLNFKLVCCWFHFYPVFAAILT